MLLQAYAALLLVELGVRFVGLLPVWRVIQRQYRPGTRGAAPAGEAERLRLLVARAARRHRLPMRCLPQSLTLAWLLARRGIPVQLRLGVQKPGGELLAHAWLESEGRCLGDADGAFHQLAEGPSLTVGANGRS